MKVISSYVKSNDFLGSTMKFKINSCGNHQTFYGGFLSMVYYGFFFYFCFTFGYNMIFLRNPSGYSQIRPGFAKNTQPLNFTELPFSFGFQIHNSRGHTVDITDILFPIFILRETNHDTGVKTVTRLKTLSCDTVIPKDKIDSKSFKTSEYLCPDLSTIADKTLKGDYTTIDSSIIEFYYSLCNHDPSNSQCKDPNKLREVFSTQKIWISALFPKVKYYINDEVAPLKIELVDEYDVLSPYKLSFDQYYLHKYHSESDYAFLGEVLTVDEAIGISEQKSFSLPVKDLPDTVKHEKSETFEDTAIFHGSVFFKEEEELFFSRRYAKIQDLLGNIVGIMKIIGFAVSYLSSSFSKERFDEFLINRLLFIENDFDSNGNPKKVSSEDLNKLKRYFNYHIQQNGAQINENSCSRRSSNRSRSGLLGEIDKGENKINDLGIKNNIIEEEHNSNNKIENEMFSISKVNLNEMPDNSVVKLRQKSLRQPENQQNKKEEVTLNLKKMIEKFRNLSNELGYGFVKSMNYMMTGKEQVKNSYQILKIYVKKINKKFDMFYYLKQNKKIKILQKSMFNSEQKKLISLISNKEYRINMLDEIKIKSDVTEQEKNSNTLNYVINSYNPKLDSPEQRIMNCLIEKN